MITDVSVTETVLLTYEQKLAFQLCIPLSYFNVFVSMEGRMRYIKQCLSLFVSDEDSEVEKNTQLLLSNNNNNRDMKNKL